MSYPPESSIGQEVPIQGNYLDWNQNAQRKSQRHPTQLIRILNSISTLIPTGTKLDSQSAANPPWQDTFADPQHLRRRQRFSSQKTPYTYKAVD